MYTLKVEDPDKLFLTSDSHLGHFNICKYCKRPFQSRSEMDKTLIQNWNSVVPKDGIVVHCGDFMLPHDCDVKEYQKYVKQLNGTIYLTRGNHDRINLGTYELDGVPKLIVNDMMMVYVDGAKIFCQHYPAAAFNGDMHAYGHIHTLADGTCYGIDGDVAKVMRSNTYDVGVDQNGYKPISYWDFCYKLRERAKKKK